MDDMNALMKPREGWTFEQGKGVPSIGIRQLRVNLPNGYSVSVIRGHGTYGGDRGLFEAAVIGPDGHLVDTDLTGGDTVIGHLTQEDAIEFLDKAPALPPAAAR